MKRLVRNLVLSSAVAATALAAVPAAHAQERVDDRTARIVGAGILGLAAGLVVGGIVASEQENAQHRHPKPRPAPDRDYFPAEPIQDGGYTVYGPRNQYRDRYIQDDQARRDYWAGQQHRGNRYRENQTRYVEPSYEAWSREWYRWCSNRYQSFKPSTGTYTTRNGEERFCVVQ